MEIKAIIQGKEYKLKDNYSIRQQVGAVSMTSIEIRVEDDFVPAVLGWCQLFYKNTPFFYGYIYSIDYPEYNSGYEVKNYRLSIQSAEMLFNYRLVSESYREVYTNEIIYDLFTKYIEIDGFELGEISKGRYFEKYDISFSKLYDILKELADDIGASFFISADKKFYFIIKTSCIEIDALSHIKKLKITENIGDLRTKQILSGASEETSLQAFVERWKEKQTLFSVNYQITQVHGATINGVPVGVGLLGINEQDTEITFLYSVFSNTITLNGYATVKPNPGDDVSIVYTGFYEILLMETNEESKERIAKISGTSGIIENMQTDETIKNFEDASKYANNLLAENAESEKTINLECHELEATEFNKVWVFTRDDLKVTGKYMVVERTISDFFDKLLIKVKLSNK